MKFAILLFAILLSNFGVADTKLVNSGNHENLVSCTTSEPPPKNSRGG